MEYLERLTAFIESPVDLSGEVRTIHGAHIKVYESKHKDVRVTIDGYYFVQRDLRQGAELFNALADAMDKKYGKEDPPMIGYKLMRQRKDGTLGSLFINTTQRVPIGKWVWAGDHPTKGFAHRPGWHIMPKPEAPHLSERGRVWVKVEFKHYTEHRRPDAQGGLWYLAKRMKVVEVL
jgi:hypothetical protein